MSSSLELCIDSVECEYPGFVTECFSLTNDRINLVAKINSNGFCSLLCNKHLFIWNFIQKDRSKLPKCYRLPVPSTGLSYVDSCICFYKRDGHKLPGVVVVSPEGTIRYWPEIGDVYKDEPVELNSEVAFSIVHIESKDHYHRFLLSTTTSSFYVVEIFYGTAERPNQLTYFNLDLNQKSAFTRRMSALIWGSPVTDKLHKTLILRNPIKDIELVCLYSASLHFYSIKQASTISEINVCDASFLHFSFELKIDINLLKKENQVRLLDASLYKDGVLFLVSMIDLQGDELSLALGFISIKSLNAKKELDYFNIVDCSALQLNKEILNVTKLQAFTSDNYCIIIFPKVAMAILNPLSDIEFKSYITPFDDELLGSGVYDSHYYLILKKHGISAIRMLPKDFDLTFWRKFHLNLESTEASSKDTRPLLKRSFAAFCSKNIRLAEDHVHSLLNTVTNGLSNLIINFAKQILDGSPINDPRWNLNNDHIKEIIGRDRSNQKLVRDQLLDKAAFYKMYIIFLNHFEILPKLTANMPDNENRNAKAALAEFGEKIYCFLFIIELIIGYTLPLVENIIKRFAKLSASRSLEANNTQLTDYDHFCKEITKVDHVISALTVAESDEFTRVSGNLNAQKEMIMQFSAFFVTVINAINRLREESWAIKLDENTSTWLNHPPFLNNFIRHITVTLDLLANGRLDQENYSSIMEQNVYIARFILNEQNRWQRDNSPIINRIYDLGEKNLAVSLAEEFLDFTTLISRHCYEARSEHERRNLLEHYKRRFANNDFDLFLYEYYRKKGMVSDLLQEKGGRVENFLSAYENINWIKNISNGEYDKAREILKGMSYESIDAFKKQSLLSLGKLAAICSDKHDPVEMAEFNHGLRLLIHQKNISPTIQQRINPQNRPMTIEEIVSADLMEDSIEGYLKALLVISILVEAPQTETQIKNNELIEELKTRVWTSALTKDNWNAFPHDETFDQNAEDSFFANLIRRLNELAIHNSIKEVLIPEVDPVFKNFIVEKRINAELKKKLKSFVTETIRQQHRFLANVEE